MRLIDADKLIMDLKNYALLNAPRRGEGVEVYDAIENCIKTVKEQPTAYDIDKHIKKLENLDLEKEKKRMYKITIESPETGVKQFEADGVYVSIVNENESKSIVATSYEKESFKPDFVIRSLVGLIDKAIREMVLSKDSEAIVKAVF